MTVWRPEYPAEFSEDDLQIAAASYLQYLEGRGHLTLNHAPLGGKRSMKAGKKFKQFGAKKGHPDLDIYLRGGRAIFIELKAMKGVVRPEQKDRHRLLRLLGFDVYVIHAATPSDCTNQIAKILRENYGIREAQ